MSAIMFWAGRQLTDAEELELRRLVARLQGLGHGELAENFERFLPERSERWTREELALGAQVGPWVQFGDMSVGTDYDDAG